MVRKKKHGFSEDQAYFQHHPALRSEDVERGRRIQRFRKMAGLNQEQLAERAGVAQSAVSGWETGKNAPTDDNISEMARIFGVSAAEIRYGGSVSSLPQIPVVGYVGAGEEIFPIDDHAQGGGLELVDAPMAFGRPAVAVRIKGESMRPLLRDGWLLFYSRESDGVPDDCLGRICVVKLAKDGPMLVKELRKGTKRGHYHLLSTNAEMIEDAPLDWASRVLLIKPV